MFEIDWIALLSSWLSILCGAITIAAAVNGNTLSMIIYSLLTVIAMNFEIDTTDDDE